MYSHFQSNNNESSIIKTNLRDDNNENVWTTKWNRTSSSYSNENKRNITLDQITNRNPFHESITFQTLNKKLIATVHTRRRETLAKRHLRSHQPNPTNLIRLPDSFHAVNRTRSFHPAGSTPAHPTRRTMAKKYSTPSISCAIYSRTDRISGHGHGNSFHIFVSKNRGRFKGRSLYELVTRNAFPCPTTFLLLLLFLLLFRGALFPRKDESRPKPFAVTRFGKLYATSGALSHHALQAQSAISCVRRRTYATHTRASVYTETRGYTRGKLFLAREIRGLEAFVSSCMVARAATRLTIVSPLENYHCGSCGSFTISGDIGFVNTIFLFSLFFGKRMLFVGWKCRNWEGEREKILDWVWFFFFKRSLKELGWSKVESSVRYWRHLITFEWKFFILS